MPVWARRHWRLLVDLALGGTLVTLYALSGTVVSVPLAVAQLVPLAWRRRAPGIALAVIGAATAAHSLLGMARAIGYLPLSLALYTAAANQSRAVRWWLCAAVVTVATVAGAIRHGPVEGGLLAAVTFVVTWLAGFERGQHLSERNAHAAESTRLQLAVQQERLARRVHDGLAHTMTVMLVQTEALRSTARLAPADRDRLDTVLRAGRSALAEVRVALAASEDATPLGVRLSALREAGLEVSLPAGLPRGEVVSRLISEVATNALRHDGPGSRLDVTLRGSTLRMVSHPGAQPGIPGGFGLRSLATDVEAVGGTLTYGPDEAGRWRVEARLGVLDQQVTPADVHGPHGQELPGNIDTALGPVIDTPATDHRHVRKSGPPEPPQR